MPYRQAIVFALSLPLLIACSDRPAEPKTAVEPHDHVWSTQTGALEKARGVEKTMQDAAERAQATDNPGY